MQPMDEKGMTKLLEYAWEKTLDRGTKHKMIVRVLSKIMSDIVLINEYAKTESFLSWNELGEERQKLLVDYQLTFTESDEYKEIEIEISKRK